MKVAHLIMAYKEPKQIERLIQKMSHKGSTFYIHVDKKIDSRPFAYLGKLENTKLTQTKLLVNWAGYSFTNAILQCIKEIFETGNEYDFINVMSGQDYPIKSNEYIYKFFSNNIGKSFLSYEAYGSQWWKSAKHRVEKYHLTDFVFKGHYRIQQFINFLMPKRKFPLSYTLYGGNCATWWTISKKCAEYIVDFIEKNPGIKRFAQFTWAPDEYLIPTIIINSHLKDTVVNNNLRYIDWSLGGANPKILLDNDLQSLEHSDKLFARKFDMERSAALLNQIDEVIIRKV
ncbi:beta-1,6-N-acetylglucosaminyltransferase [Hymenobacter defluvii]|uniref:Peptide O-xylosyltransferase n=1 Tax=Hymenobacter defluvii TaxID=2054411 RepID=A0ABS3THW5_9BACT|nr:beta-1,6-N-acetylglucosaminyltransferase [Hymenobacter defluvii]MBO3273256.1 hypothetical protein [Hymenobacter defluvii]